MINTCGFCPTYTGIPLQMLLMFENSNDAWSVKINRSNYVYANRATFCMLNLPRKFNIDGLRDEDIPHPSAEFSSHFYQQDNAVRKRVESMSSLDVHPYGRENIIQLFICSKYPFYDKSGVCIGVINHAKKLTFLSIIDFFQEKTPFSLLLSPPEKLFTEKELEIIFFMIRRMSAKTIANILKISHRTVENRIQVIYGKAGVNSLTQFTKFCEEKSFDKYFPLKFMHQYSKIINLK